MDTEAAIAQIRSYLDASFGAGATTVSGEPAGIVFQAGGEKLIVTEGFLATWTGASLPDALTRWDLAGELRRAEGLPLTLSEDGVKLASSN